MFESKLIMVHDVVNSESTHMHLRVSVTTFITVENDLSIIGDNTLYLTVDEAKILRDKLSRVILETNI